MRSKVSNVLWGLFFIIIGVGFAGYTLDLWNFNLFFNGWWTLFIIIPSCIGLIQKGFNTSSITGIVIGTLLLLACQNVLSFNIILKLIVPIIFVITGLSLIFKNLFSPVDRINKMHMENGNNRTEYAAVFSGDKIHFNNETFYGCSINAIFGGIELDLTNAVIESDVVINCSSIFGGIDIFVPSNVKVVTSNVPIFGGVSNKAKRPNDASAYTIYINSTCMFGGVEIR